MISPDILNRSRELADDLRLEGRQEDAQALETLLEVIESIEGSPAYLTTGQVAQRLGVSRQTIVNWTKQGLLPGIRLGGRMMIPASALDRFNQFEQILNELDGEREPGSTSEIVELVSQGRGGWTWQSRE
jgi:excisionase family DNA binding protein